MEKNILHSDNVFSKLLYVGDKIKITYLWNNNEIRFKTITGFDGLEYQTSNNPLENIGHSGFIVESKDVFYICINGKKYSKIERL